MMRFAILALAFAVLPAVADEAVPTTLRVLSPDGKPAAGAKVWVYPDAALGGVNKEQEPAALTTDSTGSVTVSARKGPHRVFVRDGAGRIGSGWVNPPEWASRGGKSATEITLSELAPKKGRLTRGGKPLAGAIITPTYFATDTLSLEIPEWDQARLAVKADGEGQFTLPAISGSSLWFRVTMNADEWLWFAKKDAELIVALPELCTITVNSGGIEAAKLSGTKVSLNERQRTPDTSPLQLMKIFQSTFDAKGTATFRSVIEGKYELNIERNPAAPFTMIKPDPISVTAGKNQATTVQFQPAAKLTGTITDAAGKGLADVKLTLYAMDSSNSRAIEIINNVVTDREGRYEAYGPAAWYKVVNIEPPDGYALPMGQRGRDLVEAKKVEAGHSHTFAAIVLPNAVALSGKVLLPDGKPAAGAMLKLGMQSSWPRKPACKPRRMAASP